MEQPPFKRTRLLYDKRASATNIFQDEQLTNTLLKIEEDRVRSTLTKFNIKLEECNLGRFCSWPVVVPSDMIKLEWNGPCDSHQHYFSVNKKYDTVTRESLKCIKNLERQIEESSKNCISYIRNNLLTDYTELDSSQQKVFKTGNIPTLKSLAEVKVFKYVLIKRLESDQLIYSLMDMCIKLHLDKLFGLCLLTVAYAIHTRHSSNQDFELHHKKLASFTFDVRLQIYTRLLSMMEECGMVHRFYMTMAYILADYTNEMGKLPPKIPGDATLLLALLGVTCAMKSDFYSELGRICTIELSKKYSLTDLYGLEVWKKNKFFLEESKMAEIVKKISELNLAKSIDYSTVHHLDLEDELTADILEEDLIQEYCTDEES